LPEYDQVPFQGGRHRLRLGGLPRGLAAYWTSAEIPGYGPFTLVIVHRDGVLSPQALETNPQVTDWADILALYECAWAIEPHFPKGEQDLGLATFREWRLQGIEGAQTFACRNGLIFAAVSRLSPAIRG